MGPNQELTQRLKETDVPEDILSQYQRYFDSGDIQGQRRLLCRLRRIQNDALRRDREKLACLDYIIAKVEKTDSLLQSK